MTHIALPPSLRSPGFAFGPAINQQLLGIVCVIAALLLGTQATLGRALGDAATSPTRMVALFVGLVAGAFLLSWSWPRVTIEGGELVGRGLGERWRIGLSSIEAMEWVPARSGSGEIRILQIRTDDGNSVQTRLLSRFPPGELGSHAARNAERGDAFVELLCGTRAQL